ncbi:hypothetical protein GGX14DRAFT_395419 [Mycena pura]|uniref:Uncharacterized protein n=1 Tax=Mycena pura TaxID=153505 RepID=A0AAD6Y9Y1_9AGAR|nr:hypothetical protein GGX14DRAFT_395419 [Mycena pura]
MPAQRAAQVYRACLTNRLHRVQQKQAPAAPKNAGTPQGLPDQWAAQGAAKRAPAAPKIGKTGCASAEGGYIHLLSTKSIHGYYHMVMTTWRGYIQYVDMLPHMHPY